MDTCKGLTVVSHEDLVNAVNNWVRCNKLYHQIKIDAVKYAQEEFDKFSKFKQFYLKYTKCDWLLFISCVTIYRHGEEYLLKHLQEAENGVYPKLDKLKSYFHNYILQGMVANQCKKHAQYNGVHYLTPDQVVFVNKFKELEVVCGFVE